MRFLQDSGVAVGPSLDLGRSLMAAPTGTSDTSFVPTDGIAITSDESYTYVMPNFWAGDG